MNRNSHHIVAEKVCKKPPDISFNNCLRNKKKKSSFCSDGCRIKEKSDEQIQYILSSKNDLIFLEACPGSGKTEVVALKTAFEVSNWKQLGGLAVLSFTQNAANVINTRVNGFIGVKKNRFPHFVGTIDSWLHSYVAHPFSYQITDFEGVGLDRSIRVVESSGNAPFLNAFASKYSLARTGSVKANEYFLDPEKGEIIFSSSNRGVDKARKDELDKQAVRGEDWFKDQLYELKKKFWKSGFATYQDVELICLKLLQEKKSIRELLAKRFPYIIVDECQDLSWIQLKIFETLINTGVKIHLVGDPNQAIYEFKKVDPKKVINFISTNKYKIQYLTENYRSNQRIVNLSQKLIAGKKISGKETSVNSISCICINFKKEKVKELIPWFECRLEKEGLLSKKAAVVARGWSMISKLRACGNNFLLKKQEKLITSIYLWKNHNRIARKDALFYFGEFVASHFFPKHNFLKRQFFCPEIFKPCYLWRIFLSRVLEDVTEEGCSIGDFSETWRAWAGNFRDSIIAVLNKHKKVLPSSDFEFSSFRFRALNGHSTDKVIETIPFKFDGDDCKIRTTTIHQVKGETVDALMLVSSLDKRGATKDGHWSFWLEDSSSEKARLAYVASSRPKHLLVWAVADASKGDVNRLKDMGFSIMDLR